MRKKKGQIIPRYLVQTKSRRHGYLLTFGTDVEISERRITALSDGPIVLFSAAAHYRRNKHTKHARKELPFAIVNGIHFVKGISMASE